MRAPAFVLCSERSGSNLLRVMVGAHPDIHAPAPVHLGRDVWRRLWAYGDLADDRSYELLLDHVARLLAAAFGDLGFTPSGELRTHGRSFAALYAGIYGESLRRAGKAQLFIKENHTHELLPMLLATWPDARFVHMVRDPRDYVASCRAVGRYGSVARALEVWRDDQQGALSARAALGRRVFFLRYEDLLLDPEGVLSALCRHLGADFAPEMLRFFESPDARRASQRSELWKNLGSPLMRDNAGKHRRELHRLVRVAVEDAVGDLMRLFDYPLQESPGPFERRAARAYLLADAAARSRRGLPPREAQERSRRLRLRAVEIPAELARLGTRIKTDV